MLYSPTMIKNPEFLREWEKTQDRGPPNVAMNRRLFEGMYRLAQSLGAWGPDESLSADKIALARALNVRATTRPPR